MSQPYWTGSTTMGAPPDPEPDTYVSDLVRKLKFIYKAAGNDDMVTIPRQFLADTLVALLEDELVERRRADQRAEMEARAAQQKARNEQMALAVGAMKQEDGRIIRVRQFPEYGLTASPTAAHYAQKMGAAIEKMKGEYPDMLHSEEEMATMEKMNEEVTATMKKGWFKWSK